MTRNTFGKLTKCLRIAPTNKGAVYADKRDGNGRVALQQVC